VVVHRFVGEICGFGTTSGVRVVVGRWTTSPFGLFADAMVEHADGHRVLVAPTAAVAELVGAVYEFDDIVVHKVLTERQTGSMVVTIALVIIVVEATCEETALSTPVPSVHQRRRLLNNTRAADRLVAPPPAARTRSRAGGSGRSATSLSPRLSP
jgi:hypothetical protein